MGEVDAAVLRETVQFLDRYRATIEEELNRRLGRNAPPPAARLEIVRRFRSFSRLASIHFEDARPALDGLGGNSPESLERAIERVVKRFHLESVVRRPIGNLSKGFQQRASLAQAFLHDPALVIVDEPTGGLDPVQQREVQQILGALRGERTVILCTHDLPEARTLASRVGVLSEGRLLAVGST